MTALTGLALLVLAIWFWLDSLRTREIATGIGKAACERHAVQFLDQTVALRKLGVRWGPQGMKLRRVYSFDFSEEGYGRRTGYLVMIGIDLTELSMGLPSQPGDA